MDCRTFTYPLRYFGFLRVINISATNADNCKFQFYKFLQVCVIKINVSRFFTAVEAAGYGLIKRF